MMTDPGAQDEVSQPWLLIVNWGSIMHNRTEDRPGPSRLAGCHLTVVIRLDGHEALEAEDHKAAVL